MLHGRMASWGPWQVCWRVQHIMVVRKNVGLTRYVARWPQVGVACWPRVGVAFWPQVGMAQYLRCVMKTPRVYISQPVCTSCYAMHYNEPPHLNLVSVAIIGHCCLLFFVHR
jgi:hypothetical protein